MNETKYSNDDVKALRCLLDALAYDASRRYEILREELTHLINALRYRIHPAYLPARLLAKHIAADIEKAEQARREGRTIEERESFIATNGYQGFLMRIDRKSVG